MKKYVRTTTCAQFIHSFIHIHSNNKDILNQQRPQYLRLPRPPKLSNLSPTLSTCQSLIRSLFFLFSFFPLTTHIVPVVVHTHTHTHSHFLSPSTFETSEQILRISSSSSEFFFALLEREREKEKNFSSCVYQKAST